MSREIKCGESILLPPVQKLGARLSWDNIEPMECDLMAFLMDENEIIPSRWDIIFYNVRQHISHCIRQMGMIHEGERNIDRIDIRPGKIPDEFKQILLFSCIYEAAKRGQSLATAANLRFSLINEDNGEEIVFFPVCSTNTGARSIFFGRLCREEKDWRFQMDGREDEEELIGVIATRYGMRVDWRSDYKHFDPNKGIFA